MAWIAASIVFVAVLYKFPRFVIWSVVVVTVLAGAGFGVMYLWETQASAKREAERRQVTVNVKVDSEICADPAYPLAVGIRNNGAFTINSLTFYVYGRRAGYSKSIYSSSYTDDKIIKPAEFHASCWSLSFYNRKELDDGKYVLKDLEWSAELSYFDKAN